MSGFYAWYQNLRSFERELIKLFWLRNDINFTETSNTLEIISNFYNTMYKKNNYTMK